MPQLKKIKKIIKAILPSPIHEAFGQVYRFGERQGLCLKLFIEHGKPDRILDFGPYFGLGDDLICTAALAELHKRSNKRLWMMSNRPYLFRGLPYNVHVLPINLPLAHLGQYKRLNYAPYIRHEDRSILPKRHIIAELCHQAGICGEIDLRPCMRLTPSEQCAAVWASGKLVIQSSVLGGLSPIMNKEWYPDRIREVVNHLCGEFVFVQLGSLTDPPLDNVIDLRGKTTPREAAAILFHARLNIGCVGFLMHLARAVECPSVIIYGGREAPWQSGYSANRNLYRSVSCSPCWLWSTCSHARQCMSDISVDDVIQAVHEKLREPRGPLPIDRVVI